MGKQSFNSYKYVKCTVELHHRLDSCSVMPIIIIINNVRTAAFKIISLNLVGASIWYVPWSYPRHVSPSLPAFMFINVISVSVALSVKEATPALASSQILAYIIFKHESMTTCNPFFLYMSSVFLQPISLHIFNLPATNFTLHIFCLPATSLP